MKESAKLMILFCLILLSSYSNSDALHFKWKLEHLGRLVLNGTATSSTHSSHSGPTRECYWDDPTKGFSDLSGDYILIYELLSSINIEFNQQNSGNNVPVFFYELLGNGLHNLQHSFHTRYTLRGQIETRKSMITELIFCLFCPCFFVAGNGDYQDLLDEKVRALEAATPEHLPEHVTIDSRSLSHTAVTNNYQQFLSSNTEAINDNTRIFDLFLNTPETQRWIIGHLDSTTNHVLELIIPGLIRTAIPATVLVQEQGSENLQASHFLSLNFLTGTRVQYHLNRLSNNQIEVLAIVISSAGYTLTLVIDNYDVIANQPPPHYTELPIQLPLQQACHHHGACNCATSRNNDTHNSNYQRETIGDNGQDMLNHAEVIVPLGTQESQDMDGKLNTKL
ncbi:MULTISPECIES: hypothetical protein [unclassified Endozoicomonas]|uniref:hypothetical protein n=1 Tax=unclassified Endozoicomonas TaxID=2644528 RepID=UPI003BAED3D8